MRNKIRKWWSNDVSILEAFLALAFAIIVVVIGIWVYEKVYQTMYQGIWI